MTSDEPGEHTTEQNDQQQQKPIDVGSVEKSGVPIGVIIGGILLFFCIGLTLLIVTAVSSR